MDGILKQEATVAVDTAILLTSAGVLASGGAESEEVIPSPLTRVGGLTLFQRAVLTLQRGGISIYPSQARSLSYSELKLKK